MQQFNYILVVGDQEVETQTADVRSNSGERLGKLSLADFEAKMVSEFPEGVPLPKRCFNE